MRKTITAAALAALLATGAAQAQQADKIRIGGVFSVTGGGAVITFSALAGAKMAVAEINKSGGILGKQVEFVVADDRSDPTQTTMETRRLVQQENVQMLVGPIGSVTTLASIPVLNEAKVASIGVAQAPQLTPKFAPYQFTEVVATDEIAKVYVDQAVDVLKAKKLGLLMDNTAGQKALVVDIRAYAAKKGIPIVGEQEFDVNIGDMTAQVLALKRAGPDVLLHSSLSSRDAGTALKTLADVGWDVPIIFSTSMAAGVAAVVQVAGPDSVKKDNVYAWDYKGLSYCQGDPLGATKAAQFITRLKDFAGADFAKMSSTNAGWLYDAVYILKAAAEGAGSTEGPKMAAWLESNAGKAQSVLGNLTGSPSNHFLLDSSSLTVVSHVAEVRADGLRRRGGC